MLHKVLCSLLLISVIGCGKSESRVTLYCAQDQEFAEAILADFTQRTGIKVDVKYDTEADKSVSLYAELAREKDRPRCDVHWNNEILSTIRLQRQGVLEPYASPSAASYPPTTRPRDRTWQAFAARARILIVNTKMVPEADRPRSILELTDPRWKGRIAIAKPLFGTSATQAACLFEVLGRNKAEDFYRGLQKNEVRVVPGNKQVAEGVGQGQFAVGMTDTDDAIAEVEAGRRVVIIYPDGDRHIPGRMGTLFIPNTLALIRGSPNPEGGRKLIDFLLSAEIERKLADGASHQIPLNPSVVAPKAIETPRTVKAMEVDFEKAADLWDDAQTFLRNQFAR
jgi:iron(III) transport system substrate-binding protein